jgi:hypothetical protein
MLVKLAFITSAKLNIKQTLEFSTTIGGNIANLKDNKPTLNPIWG